MPTRASTESLRALRVFADVEPDVLGELAARAQVRSAANRAVIVERGDAVTGIVIVMQGQVQVSFMTLDGEMSTLGFVGSPTMVGDAAILDGGPYGVTVIAAPECTYLWLEAAALLAAMQRSARCAFNVARDLSRRLRMMARRNEWITSLSVPGRLARFLLWTAEQQHTDELLITQEQLGNLIGVSRETVNKHLRQWARAGWIEQDGRRIVMLDRGGLATIADERQELHAS
jgi:CRP/FNR family transcriptional regulator, cyclic AMP receptor protein